MISYKQYKSPLNSWKQAIMGLKKKPLREVYTNLSCGKGVLAEITRERFHNPLPQNIHSIIISKSIVAHQQWMWTSGFRSPSQHKGGCVFQTTGRKEFTSCHHSVDKHSTVQRGNNKNNGSSQWQTSLKLLYLYTHQVSNQSQLQILY